MSEHQETLISNFNQSSMTDFYTRFTTPESQTEAISVLEKYEKVTEHAWTYLNRIIENNRSTPGLDNVPAGVSKNAEGERLIAKAQAKYQRRMRSITNAKDSDLQRVTMRQYHKQSQSKSKTQARPLSASQNLQAQREPRRHRTGRNVQFNVKAAQDTVDAFYEISDRNGWVLGETLEKALAALHETLRRDGR
jgi:hypothetical protein